MGFLQSSSRKTLNRRRALFAVSLATTLSLLGDTAMYTVLPTHTDEAGIALVSVGVLLSANRFIRLLLNGPIGLLTDRWSRRSIFIPAVYIGAISTATYALFQGFWPLLGGRLLWGLAWAGLWVSGNAIVLDISRDRTSQISLVEVHGVIRFPVQRACHSWILIGLLRLHHQTHA